MSIVDSQAQGLQSIEKNNLITLLYDNLLNDESTEKEKQIFNARSWTVSGQASQLTLKWDSTAITKSAEKKNNAAFTN